jgi:hypothetical protein
MPITNIFLKNVVVVSNDVSLADVFVCTTVRIQHPKVQCLVSCHIAAKHFKCATFCVFSVTLIKVAWFCHSSYHTRWEVPISSATNIVPT